MSEHIRAHNSSAVTSQVTGRRAVAGQAIALLVYLAIVALSACGGSGPASPRTLAPGQTPLPTAEPAGVVSSEPLPPPPSRDLLDLARRFRGYPYDGADIARTQPLNHRVGDSVKFTMLDLNAYDDYVITATVQRITDHAYFFVDEDYPADDPSLDQAAAAFESLVWPTVTGAFGEPKTPGVDGDPRITILHTPLLGAAGYFYPVDQYPKAVNPSSAEREMIYIDAFYLETPEFYNALVGHELQHLIHFNSDPSEESWVNEGLSEVAWEMTGSPANGVQEYLDKPDIAIRDWPYGTDEVTIHYAAAELLMGYVLDHYGGRHQARALSTLPENGTDGLDAYLRTHGQTFDEVFADFMAANVLDTPDGPYSHHGFDGTTSAITEVESGDGNGNEQVEQYGIDYYHMGAGQTMTFNGANDVPGSIPAFDGGYWTSMHADEMDARLTREIDLTNVGTATLRFNTSFDTQLYADYAYVAVSTDNGMTWETVPGQQTFDGDPIGVAYGPGFSGSSGGWRVEQMDLGKYIGRKILLRFEYITDQRTNLGGFAIDNIEIPEVGLLDKVDTTEGWTVEGFTRIGGPRTQTFIVMVIGDDGTVSRVDLEAGSAAEITPPGPATIAIAGTTRETTHSASYAWSIR